MNKYILINNPILWPSSYTLIKWASIGCIVGIFSLYYITILKGPFQVMFMNAPYTVLPVLLLTYTVTQLVNKQRKTDKYHELIDTIHMNLYVSFAYFLFQLIVYLFTKSLDYDNENDNELKKKVYTGSMVAMLVFIIIIVVTQLYLH
jgi:magnesium-transporting ATPase (P-type)